MYIRTYKNARAQHQFACSHWVNALYYLIRVSSKKLNWYRARMSTNRLKDWHLKVYVNTEMKFMFTGGPWKQIDPSYI